MFRPRSYWVSAYGFQGIGWFIGSRASGLVGYRLLACIIFSFPHIRIQSFQSERTGEIEFSKSLQICHSPKALNPKPRLWQLCFFREENVPGMQSLDILRLLGQHVGT